MSQEQANTVATVRPAPIGRRLHPLPVRIMHWINAVVMLIMITSGWGIYDDDPIIRGFVFGSFWRLGDWAAMAEDQNFRMDGYGCLLDGLNAGNRLIERDRGPGADGPFRG